MATTGKSAKKGGKKRKSRNTEVTVAYAVLHPVRLDILSILFERIASPNELSKMLRKPLSTVSFHVKELSNDDVIELVGIEPRRGAVEHFYRAKVKPEISDEELKALPKATRRKLAATILQAIVAESLSSLRHEKMDADDELNLIWIPMKLSTEGRGEVNELQAEMFERLEAIKALDAERPQEESAPVKIAAMLWFERGRPDGIPPGDAISLSEIEE